MLYKHYSGNLYRVIHEGLYEPTLEEVTIYICVKTGRVWVRPSDIFHELITIDGITVPRFAEVDESL